MDYDPHYPTILPTVIALWLVLALNLLIPVAAYFIARRFQRHKWLPHTLAFLWVLTSIFTFGALGMPTLAPDEAPGPGDGFVMLPVAAEAAVVLVGYLLAFLSMFIAYLI